MHIWLITHYYPPEIGAAAVRLSRLARSLVAHGHSVTVITTMPNYPAGRIAPEYRGRIFHSETLDGVQVRRVWLYASPRKGALSRILNQLSFAALAALRGTFMGRPDVLLVESHPLFVCLTGGWLKRIKRVPVVLNVSDLWPESAVATGALAADSLLVRLALPLERWAYRDAAQVVGMTEGVMAGITPHTERATLIRNAVDLTRFHPASDEERAAAKRALGWEETFTAVHVGNMSLTYDLDLLLEAARRQPELRLMFVGGGSQAEALQAKAASLPNVRLLGTLPHDRMPLVWAAADICLIALRDHAVAGGTLPAKLYEALATGTPVVAAIRGEGAHMLETAGVGAAVPIGDASAFSAAIDRLRADPALRQQMTAAGRAFAEAHLQVEQNVAAYQRLLYAAVGIPAADQKG